MKTQMFLEVCDFHADDVTQKNQRSLLQKTPEIKSERNTFYIVNTFSFRYTMAKGLPEETRISSILSVNFLHART